LKKKKKNASQNHDSNFQFKFRKVSNSEVKSVLNSLNNTRSAGWDEVPLFVIKKVFGALEEPICRLVNQSLEQGIFPEKLKLAEVKPIFKKGDVNNPSDYRPIALLPCFSKILEKIVKNQLIEYLENNKLITPSQFGFRTNLNTQKAIENMINSIAGGPWMGCTKLSV